MSILSYFVQSSLWLGSLDCPAGSDQLAAPVAPQPARITASSAAIRPTLHHSLRDHPIGHRQRVLLFSGQTWIKGHFEREVRFMPARYIDEMKIGRKGKTGTGILVGGVVGFFCGRCTGLVGSAGLWYTRVNTARRKRPDRRNTGHISGIDHWWNRGIAREKSISERSGHLSTEHTAFTTLFENA